MQWLRNVHVAENRKFSDYVDRLLPVLDRGAAATQGIARADRVAHIGWGYYLKLRDGPATLDPPAQYKLALQADGDNPYAHAFWGHWMVWQREPLADAMAHFNAAAGNPGTLAYVRTLEIAALRSRTDNPARAQLLRVVDQMWRNGETVSAGARNDAFSIYNSIVLDGKPERDFTDALPADEHIALIDEIVSDPDIEPWRTKIARAAQALFHEQAGESGAALAIWRVLRANLDTREMTLRSRVDAAIKRLQPAPATR